jgi:regulator of RNase E activity RraB
MKQRIAKVTLIERARPAKHIELVDRFARTIARCGYEVSEITKERGPDGNPVFGFSVLCPRDSNLMVNIRCNKRRLFIEAQRRVGKKFQYGTPFPCPTYDSFRLLISNWGINLPA